jgi:hypothetical protein
MARSNDGPGYQSGFSPPLPGQDRKHFPLGTSTARPAYGYWASRANLSSDRQIEEAIAGMTNAEEIQVTLMKLLGYDCARDYMLYYKIPWNYKLRL